MRRDFTVAERAEMISLYESGMERYTIAKTFLTKGERVTAVLREAGLVIRPRRRNALTVGQERAVVVEYPHVKSSQVLADKYGCDRITILNILKRAGVSAQRRGGVEREFSPEQLDEMVTLYAGGLSQEKIARQIGTSQPKVSDVLIRRGARPTTIDLRGEKHPNWKGGRIAIGQYIGVHVAPDSPYAPMRMSGGYVMEHRLVMAEALGRPLFDHESVHHIDGNPQNNDLSNLQLRFGKHGKGVAYRCAVCGSRHIVADELA